MKILALTPDTTLKSGWARYSKSVLEHLIQEGIEVTMLSSDRDETIPLLWHRLAPLEGRFAAFRFIKNIWTVRSLARNVDVVHAFDGWPFGVYGYFGVIGTNKKLFINGIGTYSVAPLYAAFKRPLLLAAYKKAQKLFCISSYVGKEMVRGGTPADKIQVVHMGATPLPELTPDEIAEYRHMFKDVLEHAPIILTVGAISDRKGQLDTLKAVHLLKEKHPKILYVIVGKANREGYLAEIHDYAAAHDLKDNLVVISDSDDKKLAFLYSVCTVLALSSTTNHDNHHMEGFGLVVLEGYQYGKPAVGSRESGIEDAIEDGVTGLLTNQRDTNDIAEKIEKVLSTYDYFSQNASMKYKEFTWQKTVKTYIQGYLINS